MFRIDGFCTGTPFFRETVKAVCALEMGHRHITFYSYKPQIFREISYTALCLRSFTTQSSLIFWLLDIRHGMKILSGNEARCQGAEQVLKTQIKKAMTIIMAGTQMQRRRHIVP